MKVCHNCKVSKPNNSFTSQSSDGYLESDCNSCRRVKRRTGFTAYYDGSGYLLKQCKDCDKVKGLDDFFVNGRTKDGLEIRCITCYKKLDRRCTCCGEYKNQDEFVNNKARRDGKGSYCTPCQNKKSQQEKEIHPERVKNRAKKHLDRKKQSDPDYARRVCQEWRANNPEKARASVSRRRAAKYNATPYQFGGVSDEEINLIYYQCPEGYEVDHIVPLRSKIVCGLHVPWNLQYLLPSENRKKSNMVNQDVATGWR